MHRDWLGLKAELPERQRLILTILSFVVPLVLWCAVSYVPFFWHPLTRITDPGSVEYFGGHGGAERRIYQAARESDH
jgi:NitT/TauT family transport system permease protein